MANWHGYLLLENLALNATQRNALITELKRLGPFYHPQPAKLLAYQPRLDNQAALFEAEFNTDKLTLTALKQFLADIFSITPAAVMSNVDSSSGDQVITLSFSGTDYLIFTIFGRLISSWSESGDSCRAYMVAHTADWNPDLS